MPLAPGVAIVYRRVRISSNSTKKEEGMPRKMLLRDPGFRRIGPTSAIWAWVLLATIALVAGCVPATSDDSTTRATVMQRVLDGGKIRCSYLIYSPYFRKDPNTGELSGIFHDVMEEIGKNSDLEIDWVEEVGYENIFVGLDAARYDVFAGGLYPNASRAKVGSFTIPVFYSIVTTWGRPDEHRFDEDLSAIDSPSVRIATIDGAIEDIIAKTDFPNASRVSLPQLSPFTQNFLNITSGKADITFAEPGLATEYLQANPGAIQQLSPDNPLRIFGNSLVVRTGEVELLAFLDVGLRELLFTGRIDKILAKYEPAPNVFPRVATPYRLQAVN